MDITVFFYVTLIFLILKADKTIAQCEPKRKEFDMEFPGMALTSKMLGSSNTEEIICQYSCHSHDNCDAYNYKLDDGRCEVLDARSSFFNVVMRPGWIFRAQKCEADPCLNRGTCFHAIGKDRCLCDPCSRKGELCDVPITNSDIVMSFPGGSVNDLVSLENPFLPLRQLSVSMWLQIDPSKAGLHSPLSYATKAKTDVIGVILKPTGTSIRINFYRSVGKFTDPSQLITDSNWHHLLFTWENVNGKVLLYIDGVKRGEKVNVATGETIDQGALVLGQEQDSYLGGYQSNQLFKGNLTSLNMWDKVLTASEITDLATKCPTQEGNILTWTKLMNQPRSGNVKLICSPFCVPLQNIQIAKNTKLVSSQTKKTVNT